MAIYFLNKDKEARAQQVVKRVGVKPDDKDYEERVLVEYKKLRGAFEVYERAKPEKPKRKKRAKRKRRKKR